MADMLIVRCKYGLSQTSQWLSVPRKTISPSDSFHGCRPHAELQTEICNLVMLPEEKNHKKSQSCGNHEFLQFVLLTGEMSHNKSKLGPAPGCRMKSPEDNVSPLRIIYV